MDRKVSIERTTVRRLGSALAPVVVLLLLVFLFAPSAAANTSLFSDSRICTAAYAYCQALSYYGVLKGDNSTTLTVNGTTAAWSLSDIGIGSGSELSKTGANTATGVIDFANTVNSNSNCSGAPNYCGAGSFTVTPTNTNAARVNMAESALDSVLTTLATYNTGTPGSFGTSGTINIQTTPGNLKIYRNTTNYTQSGAITLGCGGSTCNANDLVLIILAGSGSQAINRNIGLADGLTSDQVIFYIPTGTLAMTPSVATASINGSFFLAGSSASTIGATSGTNKVALHGHVYADLGALTFNNRGGSQDDNGPIPEPGTWVMMASGLGAAVWMARRRKKAA